jgi:YesN/AraC family two-component response regulator
MEMKIFIQNMVSQRCKMMVKAELDRLQIPYIYLDLGEVLLKEPATEDQINQLKESLHLVGLEVMDDQKAMTVEKIKNIIVEMVHYSDELPVVTFSHYLSEKLDRDYHSLSELFSKTKGITIEHYVISNKIERAKELIMYDELTLSEIAHQLRYSSVAHLSNQFKKNNRINTLIF